ncbi:MAG: tetratricopeptide repeat protein [Tannerella sp.]|jgi:tetratricopeptide (TPR) repeat protein|nr:tetratricopeptide repeat protein [Tannerella sp.]
MKIKGFLVVAGIFATIASASAQKGVDNGTRFGSGEDSLRCLTNISLATSYAKVNNFSDAYPFWKIAYDECPASTKDLYLYGVRIVNWQISQETDPAKQATLIDDLMGVYDKRVKYFGDDPRYGKDWIVARKAQDYMRLKGENIDPKLMYGWLGEAVSEYKDKTDPLAVSLYMFASYKVMEKDESHKGKYVEDFLESSKIFDAEIEAAKAANDEKEVSNVEAMKADIERNFAGSGAADCETLARIYGDKIEQSKDDIKFLKETLVLLRRVQCQDSEVFFKASEYAHRIEPTAESALGMGKQSLKNEDFELAEKYLLEAVNLSTETDVKGDIYYSLALMAYNNKSYSKARTYCLQAVEADPAKGTPYLLIGNMYAATANSTSDDPVIRKCAFYAAVDKFEKARQVDESVSAEAGKLISSYRQYFPTNEEIFMHPDLEKGKAVTIGGWIGERTIVR